MATQETLARLLIELKADSSKMKADLNQANSQISSFASGATKLLSTIGIGIGIGAMIRELKEAITYFNEYNSSIEQSRIGIASLVTATSQITDETGKILEGEEQWNAALEISEGLYKKIQAAAAATAAEVPDIVTGFQSMIAPGTAAGLTLEEILDTSIKITQAMNAMNLPMIQMRVEAKALLTGIGSAQADILKNLDGITQEGIKNAIKLGNLYEYLSEGLGSFERAGQAQMETWQGLKSTISDITGMLGASAEAPLFEAVKGALKDISDSLFENKNGIVQFTEAAQKGADQIAGSMEAIVLHFEAFRNEYGALLDMVLLALKTINSGIAAGFAQLTALLLALRGVVTTVMVLIDTVTFDAIPGLSKATHKSIDEQLRMWRVLEEQIRATKKAMGANVLSGNSGGFVAEENRAESGGGVSVSKKGGGIDPEVLKKSGDAITKLTEKTARLQAETVKLTNPVKASKLALEMYIAKVTDGAAETPKLKEATENLREAFRKLEAEKIGKLKIEALDKAELSRMADDVKAAMIEIQSNYDAGTVDLETAFDQRRAVLEAAVAKEIDILERKLSKATTAPEKITIQAEIDSTTAELQRNIVELTRDEKEAIKEVTKALREQQAAKVYQNAERALQALNNRYGEGLVTIRDYYEEKRVLAQTVGGEEIAVLEKTIKGQAEGAEKIQLQTQLLERKAELQREILRLTNDETVALETQGMDQLAIQAMWSGLKADSAMDAYGGEDEAAARFKSEMDLLAIKHEAQLDEIRNFADERISLDGIYYDKAEALAMVHERQQMDREKRMAAYRVRVLQTQLGVWSKGFAGLESVAQQAYDQSGESVEAFWYLAKAAAIAQAIVNTAVAITMAIAQGGPYAGPYLAAAMAAIGGAQVALIGATMIQGPGAAEGGLITEGTGPKADDVPIRVLRGRGTINVSRGEYVQPDEAVDFYGVGVMEAMRQRQIPREVFSGLTLPQATAPAVTGFSGGGSTINAKFLESRDGHTINTRVDVALGAPVDLGEELQDRVQETVEEVLRKYT